MKEWLLSLSAAAVIMLLLEYLIVGDSIKKTVKFALALLFMLLVLSPIVTLLKTDISIGKFGLQQSVTKADYESVLKQAAGLKGASYGNLEPKFKKNN